MAFQNVIGNKLAQAEMTTSYETIYTTPASTRTYIKTLDICNSTANVERFYIHLVARGESASTANCLFYNAPINGNTTVQWTGSEIVTPGDTIQVKASAAGIAISITGGEAT